MTTTNADGEPAQLESETGPGDVAGMVVAVTGGSSGIGLAVAELLTRRGARVAVLDLAAPPADAIDGLTYVPCNVTSTESVTAAVAVVGEQLGSLDALVNSAGISSVGTVEEATDDDWKGVLDVNVVGVARVTKAAVPLLRSSSAPSVVNISSIAAVVGLPQRVAYSASKGAVQAMTLAMAADHVHEGIRFNCVSPGTVSTPFVERMLATFPDPVAERAALDARQATGRMVTPAEVAAAIGYLVGRSAASTTGSVLSVDGGVQGLRTRPR